MLTRWRRKAIAWGQRMRVRLPLLSWTSLRGAYHFAQLIEILRILRGPHGCPWDQKQQLTQILPYLREEAIEVLLAGHQVLQDHSQTTTHAFAEEIGDLTFVSLFLARINEEEGHFSIADAIHSVVQKMLRRHPHVFDDSPRDTEAINRNWQKIKAQEKRDQGHHNHDHTFHSILDGAFTSMSALQDALQVSKRVVKVGFEWPDIEGVWDKVLEEVEELRVELPTKEETKIAGPTALRPSSDALSGAAALQQARQRDELGDLLFTLVNLGRHLGIDCDEALRGTCVKFIRRFQYIERTLHKEGQSLEEAGLDTLEKLWQQAKAAELPHP